MSTPESVFNSLLFFYISLYKTLVVKGVQTSVTYSGRTKFINSYPLS